MSKNISWVVSLYVVFWMSSFRVGDMTRYHLYETRQRNLFDQKLSLRTELCRGSRRESQDQEQQRTGGDGTLRQGHNTYRQLDEFKLTRSQRVTSYFKNAAFCSAAFFAANTEKATS